MLAAAAQKTGRTELVHRALALFSNLHQDEWPEYYDEEWSPNWEGGQKSNLDNRCLPGGQ